MLARSAISLVLLGFAAPLAIAAPASPVAPQSSVARPAPRPTIDATASLRASSARLDELARLSRDPALAAVGVPKHVDESTGVPSFVLAARGPAADTRLGTTAEQAARDDIRRLAPYYRLTPDDVRNAPLRYVNDGGKGAIVAVFRQEVDGVPVFRDEMKVLLDHDRNLVAVSGSIPPRADAASHVFRLDMTDAIAAALSDLAGATIGKGVLRHTSSKEGGYELFEAPGAATAKLAPSPIRARRVFFRLGESLVPAYHVELIAQDEAPTYVIGADDGRILLRHDGIMHDSYSYRVWADPTGLQQPLDGPQGSSATPYPTPTLSLYTPPVLAPPLLSLQNGPISTNDPWLPPGATKTSGNNVDAAANPGGGSTLVYATPTSANTFDRTYDVNQQPDASAGQTMAAVTQIFYNLNFLHDWFYDCGFNEAAGNPQVSNYGRGGLEGDPILARTQIGINFNAYMYCPADGANPVTSQYFWFLGRIDQVTVNSPASFAGIKTCSAASSNAATVDVTANVALPSPGTFTATSSTLTTGSSPHQVAIADLNGDGHLDFAVANANSNSVSVFLSDGAGGFLAPIAYATGGSPQWVVTMDLNKDGLPDLVAANLGGTLSVHLNTGGGAFGANTLVTATSGANAIAVGRFDADTLDDVAVTCASSNTVNILLGNGTGGFQPKTSVNMGFSPYSVAVGDLNHDGFADLVVANLSQPFVTVRLGLGNGTFGASTIDSIANSPKSVALADLNGDGKLDAITANSGNNTVSVAFGNGTGGFGPATMYAVPASPVSVIAKDFNGDGIVDVIVACNPAGSVSLLANNGAGVLGTPQTIAVGTNPLGVSLGDVTGDGQADLLTANSGSGNVTLLTGAVTIPTSFCPPFANTLNGRIALVPIGDVCSMAAVLTEAAAKGAAGALFSASFVLPFTASATIPAYEILNPDAQAMRSALRAGTPVSLHLYSASPLARDGEVDNLIVAHEYGHALSGRSIGDGSGFTTQQSYGLAEGWSDFVAMLLVVRPEDAVAPNNTNWSGTYGLTGHVLSNSLAPNNTWYFGTRRYPYSTDFSKDPLTFQHIQDGDPLPIGPLVQNNGVANSEGHNAGEVWCTALWECYASLLRDTGRLTFTQARDRMRRYLVESLQMTPVGPTFLEARDALLAVAAATDEADEVAFCAAFARRGMGSRAVGPPPSSTNDVGVGESYDCVGGLGFASIAADDSLRSCDHDNVVDGNEDGHVVVSLQCSAIGGPVPATTMTVTSTNPNLWFPDGNTVSVSSGHAGGFVTGKVRVWRNGLGTQTDHYTIQYGDPSLMTGARSATAIGYGNVDETPSATESFNETTCLWTSGSIGTAAGVPWTRVQPDTNSYPRYEFCPDTFVVAEQELVSPPLHVGAGNFSFTFQHVHKLDYDTGYGFQQDGGVVEISTDGGATWNDLGPSLSPGYTGLVYSATNPIYQRAAYGRYNPDYPNYTTVTANLGTTYAGQTVRIRFVLATDGSHGFGVGWGWQLDNVAFTGLTDQPFRAVSSQFSPCFPTGVDDAALPQELAFALEGANPSLGAPRFRFELPAATHVTISLYDVSGRRIATLADGTYHAGVFHTSWNGSGSGARASAGVYFARMNADGRAIARRVVILGAGAR